MCCFAIFLRLSFICILRSGGSYVAPVMRVRQCMVHTVLLSTSTTGTLAPVDVRLETQQQCVSYSWSPSGGKCLDHSEACEQTQ